MAQMVLPLGDVAPALWVPTQGSELARVALASEAAIVCIFGPEGAGKSHLLRAAGGNRVVFDGVDGWDKAACEDLFYAANAATQGQGRIAVASRLPIAQLGLLADVKSRLLLGTQVELGLPDDEELRAIWRAWAQARQVELPQAVEDFVLVRASRNPGVLRGVFDRLDALGLEQRRAVTVPLVREFFLD
jgi:chromosomal replication initiation ATPase DnaA